MTDELPRIADLRVCLALALSGELREGKACPECGDLVAYGYGFAAGPLGSYAYCEHCEAGNVAVDPDDGEDR